MFLTVMAASSFSRAARPHNIQLIQTVIRNGNTQFIPKSTTLKVPVRWGGHRTMIKEASRFGFRTWRNDALFYFYLGAIPAGVVITAANLFVGPAELADIPEGYEPKEWEYFRHPIRRFFAKYVYESPETSYTKRYNLVAHEQRKQELRKLGRKVKGQMEERRDVKGWYYHPFPAERYYKSRKEIDSLPERTGPKI